MWPALCYAQSKLPTSVSAALTKRLCGGKGRKGSETFDDDSSLTPTLTSLGNINFEEDKLWGILRPIPGLLLWVCVAACFILPISAPMLVAVITIACMMQSTAQIFFSTLYNYQGFKRMEKAMMDPVAIPPMPEKRSASQHATSSTGSSSFSSVDHSDGSDSPPAATVVNISDKTEAAAPHPAEVMHMVAICRCTEPVEVLEETIDHLACHSNRKQYVILLCLEAKDKAAAAVGEGLIARYSGFFGRVMYAIHPSGIESEVPGKSANVNWAVRAAHASLDSEWGTVVTDRIAVTVADCDAKISEHYFNELSVRFAAAARDKREAFWAPPSLFDIESAEAAAAAAAAGLPSKVDPLETLIGSNGASIMRGLVGAVIPAPVKVADQMWSMFVLQNLTGANWCRLPCSTYSVGLRLIASVGYWDAGVESVPEDYHTALKIYWGTGGRARLEPIYHPVLYQHIDGGSWFGTVNQRFQQGIRHMWGATDFAYILWLFFKVKTVPLPAALRMVGTVVDVHLSTCSFVFLSTFAMPMLALLKPGFLSTGVGPTLVSTQQYIVLMLYALTIVTGLTYEWYAGEMVAACKRRENIMGATPGAEDHFLAPPPSSPSHMRHASPSATASVSPSGAAADPIPPTALALAASSSPTSPTPSSASSSHLSSHHMGPRPLVMGMLERKNRNVFAMLPKVTGAGTFDYCIRMLPWLWTPLVVILYLLGPAALAQTKLIVSNRMKKPHVSAKLAMTPSPTPRPGAAAGGAGGAASAAGGSKPHSSPSSMLSPSPSSSSFSALSHPQSLPSTSPSMSSLGGVGEPTTLDVPQLRLQLPAALYTNGASSSTNRFASAALSVRASAFAAAASHSSYNSSGGGGDPMGDPDSPGARSRV